ncbi:hypothetical protein [Aquimarina sp. 2201CG14-23]|uniref:hypothetical protein n=1 Tax=Aquimarina mycalae TaxID=3040073 RepID=UPI0024780C92|nr:hypothetical protein [Aquimarina sp. 2201CG14-23]MDH7447266.1 hypothetical protein [Aquimarina sp. 2201CG14-23]
MKTLIVTKLIRIIYVMSILLLISCDTDIPEIDTTVPEFSFNISGDGFNRTFTQDDDFSGLQLNLNADTEYDFIFTGSDSGGVERISWQYPHDYIEFITEIPAPWENTSQTFISSLIYWNGDQANPTTGNILTGKLITNGDIISISFSFLVKDFGGSDGTSNTTTESLNIYIGNHTTEVIDL